MVWRDRGINGALTRQESPVAYPVRALRNALGEALGERRKLAYQQSASPDLWKRCLG